MRDVAAELRDGGSALSTALSSAVRAFYGRITELGGAPFFDLWRRELRYLYGDLEGSLNRPVCVRETAARYGIEGDIDAAALLMGLQTAFGCILRALLGGGWERALGEDWTAWPFIFGGADEGVSAIDGASEAIKNASTPRRGGWEPDKVSLIYESLIPEGFRHALGEYNTPSILADALLEGICEGERLIDPSCGTGTVLVRAVGTGRTCLKYAAGCDVNLLNVVTTRARLYLASGETDAQIWQCDALDLPERRGEGLSIRLTCGFEADISKELLSRLPAGACGRELMRAAETSDAVLYDRLCAFGEAASVIAREIADRIAVYRYGRADAAVGNPPWVNREYISPYCRAASEDIWRYYGLMDASGRERSFAKADVSALVVYAVLDRLVEPGGRAVFALREALFQAERNGAGFRRFRLPDGEHIAVTRVEELGRTSSFWGVAASFVIAELHRGEEQRFPVRWTLWREARGKRGRKPKGHKASFIKEERAAFPTREGDAASPWARMDMELHGAAKKLLGGNVYRARTGVFTGGANGVYRMEIISAADGLAKVRNVTDGAKRAVPQIETELETEYLYPFVTGSGIRPWRAERSGYILCPHTAVMGLYPVDAETLMDTAPRCLEYLASQREALEARRGFAGWERELQRRSFYTLLRVGPYSFAPWKTAWRYIGREFICAVVPPADDRFLGKRVCLPGEKVVFVGFTEPEEAYYLCGVLGSAPVRTVVRSYMNPTCVTANVLDKLAVPAFDRDDPLHRRISDLCRAGHMAEGEELARLMREADMCAAELFGLSPRELELMSR